MSFRTPNAKPSVFAILIAISVLMLGIATTSVTQTAIAQNQSQGQSTAPLNFYLKLNNNQTTSQASSQAASNGTGTKNMTITVNVQKGSGNSIKLPISAIVPNNINPQDLQLCASLSSGQQMCQPLGQNAANIDLSSANSTAKTTPQSYQENKANILGVSLGSLVQYADAQLISVNNTTLNIPITVIVPITLEIQNAQICATVASSGGQSCQQIVLNPTQSAYTPVNVDLANPTTPSVTTLAAAVPSTQQITGSPTAGTNNTSSGTNGSNTSSGTSGGTGNNSTADNTASTSNQPSSTESNPTTSQPTTTEPTQDTTDSKDKKNQDKKDTTTSTNNGNSGN